MKLYMKSSVAILALGLGGCVEYSTDFVNGVPFGMSVAQNNLVQTGSGLDTLNNLFSANVPTVVNFEFNQSTLDAAARASLDKQAQFIRGFPMIRFRVYGHTDLVGGESFNRGLGMRRAQAVANYLVSRGVSPSQVEAVVTKGKSQPLVNTPNPERLNRRAQTQIAGMATGYNSFDFDGKRANILYTEYVLGIGPEVAEADAGGGEN